MLNLLLIYIRIGILFFIFFPLFYSDALGFTNLLADSVEFRLSAKEVAKGEPLTVEARINGHKKFQPVQKVFSEGRIKAIYSGTMTETKIINFNTSTYTILKFTIVETKPGRYKVPSIQVSLDGRVHRIPETYFTVSNKTKPKRQSGFPGRISQFFEDTGEIPNTEGIEIRFHTNKTEVYMGEPIIGYFILYSKKRRIPTFERNPNESISFPFFASELLTGVQVTYPETVDLETGSGREEFFTKPYNREIYSLIPLKTGDFLVGKTHFELYNSHSFRLHSEKISVMPQKIKVKSLPKPIPSSFSGEVGNFEVDLNYSGTEVEEGEKWRFSLTVKGEGLCNRLKDPILRSIPKNFPGRIVSLGVDRESSFSENEDGGYSFECQAIFRYAMHLNKTTSPFESKISFFNPRSLKYEENKILIPAVIQTPRKPREENDESGNQLIENSPKGDFEDFSDSKTPIPWKKVMVWGIVLGLLGAGGYWFQIKVRPGLTRRREYLKKIDQVAGEKSGLLLERSLQKTVIEEEAGFLRSLRDKYTGKTFQDMFSILDYKEREILENYINKET